MEPGLNDEDNLISFDNFGKVAAKRILLEKLEGLLSPEATSLRLTLQYGTKRMGQVQKQTVAEVLTK